MRRLRHESHTRGDHGWRRGSATVGG